MSDAYKWFPDVRRFRDAQGRFISDREVERLVDEMTQTFAAQVYDTTTRMINEFTEERFYAWATNLRSELNRLHTSIAMVGLGGQQASLQVNSVNSNVWAIIEAMIAEQERYFDRFMFHVIAGMVAFNSGLALRASLYGLAGYSTYQQAVNVRERMIGGRTQERRHIRSANPCPTCLAQASLGWQPIGTLRRIGDSECIVRCRCYFTYK